MSDGSMTVTKRTFVHGAAILAAAGYDPGGLLEMLKVLQRVHFGNRGGLISTHPTLTERIANAEEEIFRYRVSNTRLRRITRFRNK